MLVDLNSVLVVLVLLTWVFFLSAMLFPDSNEENVERLKEKQEQQYLLQNIEKNLKELQKMETECKNETNLQPETKIEPEETEFFNNDVSTIAPMNASGILYDEQNDVQKKQKINH